MEHQLRFRAGDRVRVRPEDPGRFAGLEGKVTAVEPNSLHVAVLDRYFVVFKWGETQTFYEAQLLEAEGET